MAIWWIKPAKRIKKVKSIHSQEVLQRLQIFLESDTVMEMPVRILARFWEDQQNVLGYPELRQIVQDGTVSQEALQLWSQDYSVLVANQFHNIWMDAIQAGAAGQPLLDGIHVSFQTQTSGVLNWIQQRGAEFVTVCTEEQKQAIATLLTKKMRDRHTLDELSRMIRPCIGLTKEQAKANARYYDNMVENLKKEHPKMKLESIQKKAQDAAQKYAERQHRQRAITIAQTESAFAYNRGADEGIRQAQEQHLLGVVKKRWCTSGDDAVCEICASLDGIEMEMDADFKIKGKILFKGQHMLPPAHPRCACAVEYIEIRSPQMSIAEDKESLSVENLENVEEAIEHNKPQYLGSLDEVSDHVVKSTLEKYESEIVESHIENAIVITKEGLVWHCYGDKENVYIDSDLGELLNGASVTHNHPRGSANEYSFSKNDINLFMEYNLKILRGIDEKYIYELSRNSTNIDSYATLEELMNSDGSLARHEKVIEIARELRIGYRRWRR